MPDLISREAAIAAIEKARSAFALPDDVPGSRELNAGFAAARGAVKNVRSPWVSVKDELPEGGERVLIYDDVSRETCTGYLYEGVWHGESYQEEHDVSHWMPLPDKPVE